MPINATCDVCCLILFCLLKSSIWIVKLLLPTFQVSSYTYCFILDIAKQAWTHFLYVAGERNNPLCQQRFVSVDVHSFPNHLALVLSLHWRF